MSVSEFQKQWFPEVLKLACNLLTVYNWLLE